jgi:hypothetical protein
VNVGIELLNIGTKTDNGRADPAEHNELFFRKFDYSSHDAPSFKFLVEFKRFYFLHLA